MPLDVHWIVRRLGLALVEVGESDGGPSPRGAAAIMGRGAGIRDRYQLAVPRHSPVG